MPVLSPIRHRMRTAPLVALALACSLALLPVAASGAVAPAVSANSISGAVYEEGTGTPLEGITVRLWVQTVGVWGAGSSHAVPMTVARTDRTGTPSSSRIRFVTKKSFSPE